MTPASLISGLANHLWQSTAAALFVGLLAWVLRRNAASIRHALWMIASLKFLVPFSLLMAAGGYVYPVAVAPAAQPKVSAIVGEITEPFSQPQPSRMSVPTTTQRQSPARRSAKAPIESLPLFLAFVWGAGFLVTVISWRRQWRNVRAIVRNASPVGSAEDLPVLASKSMLEPGVFGIIHPILLVPEGIGDRLTPSQFRAVVAHELCHARRRDNLCAAFHVLVQALFWFHPLVWWIGTRLVEERERACDEAVLQSGNEAETYAEGILNVCKLYLESPLACVSGVTGADLKRRIVRIVARQVAIELDFTRKLLLGAAGFFAVAAPVTIGLLHVSQIRAQTTAHDLTGNWQGTLHAGKDLRTILKVTKGAGDAYSASLYSIDQGPGGMPVKTISLQGATVKYEIPMIDGSYEGKLSADGHSIVGTWTQGGRPLPLNLERATPETAWTIPEPPPRLPPMAADAKPIFEVATIKPSKPDQQGKGIRVQARHFSTLNTTLNNLVAFSYGVQTRQIVGGPAWMDSDKFDLDAQPDGEGQPNDKQWKTMLQKLITDRFKFTVHHEQKELSVYAMTIAKSGLKMDKSQDDPNGLPGLFFTKLGTLAIHNANMSDLSMILQSAVLDRPVVDQTGLEGRFESLLKWTPDDSQFRDFGMKITPPTNAADAPPDLFKAMQDQLGLKLDSTKAPVDVLVIDHVEKPSEN